MRYLKFTFALLSLCLAVVGTTDVGATTVFQMNLEKLCLDSQRIFRGTVLNVTEERIVAGGGEIPAVVYTLRVDEAFKGDFEQAKEFQVAQVKMIGTLKHVENGKRVIPGFPLLRVGQEYLLMVAPEGPIGLTATLGLGQGCFSISGREGSKVALNDAGNAGLFRGMNVANMPSSGAVPYDALAQLIRDIVGGAN